MKLFPSWPAGLHLRFPFSFFLLPVFIFALSQAPVVNATNAWLVFFVWHVFVYPASNGYNSYFDRDEGSIALLEHPPAVDSSLYYSSLVLEAMGIVLALIVGLGFAAAVLTYSIISKLYSHPLVRLKKYPILSFLVVFFFQGAFVYWATYFSVSKPAVFFNWDVVLAGLICSCLIGASYPLTQVYQHKEDSKRGDRTLSLMLGVKGSFWFSACMFALATLLLFFYWANQGRLLNFWIFVAFSVPVFAIFIKLFLAVLKDENQANYKNTMRMTFASGLMMLAYFLVIWLKG